MVATIGVAVGLAVMASTPVDARKSLSPTAPSAATYVTKRASNPPRLIVTSTTGAWLATFTKGSRSVALKGPSRRFTESTTPSAVETTTWVRLLPSPFSGALDQSWLMAALSDTTPDVLELAMQYITAAPSRFDKMGLRIAGDADYGPLQADGTRAAGSDFNDYLGLSWTYPDGSIDPAESAELGAIDCSGFIRTVLGYRAGVPISLAPDGGRSIPRHSWDIAMAGPGVVVIPNTGTAPASRSALQAGDLVFFDASTVGGTRIDHVGMYLGTDTRGRPRFVSSRKTANGPTLGDLGGLSVLDGTGLYARTFRTARRI